MSAPKRIPNSDSWTSLVPAIGVFGLMPLLWVGKLIDPVLLPQYFLLALVLGMASVGAFRNNGKKFSFPRWPLFAMLALLTLVWVSMFQALNLPLAFYESLRWTLLVMLVLVFYQLLQKKASFFPVFLKTLVVANLIQASFAVWNWLPYVTIDPTNPYPVGTHTNSNLFGLAFLFSLPFLALAALRLSRIWQIISWASVVVALFMVYQSGSRSASMALFLGLLVLSLILGIRALKKSPRRTLLVFALALPVLGLAWLTLANAMTSKVGSENFHLLWEEQVALKPESSSLDHRMVLWNKSMRMVADQPLTGVGIGNWKLNVQAYGFQSFDEKGSYGMDIPQRAHNHFLEIAAETGIPGMVVLLALFGLALVGSIKLAFHKDKARSHMGLAMLFFWLGGFISCTFNFPLERPVHLSLFAIAFATSFQGFSRTRTLPNGLTMGKTIGLVIVLATIACFKMRDEVAFKKAMQMKADQNWDSLYKFGATTSPKWQPINPQSGLPMPWYTGMAALSKGNLTKGLSHLKIASNITPHHLGVRSVLAAAYNLNGEWQQAKSAYAGLLKDFPDFEDAKLNLAITHYQTQDFDAAKRVLAQIVSLKEDPRYIALTEQLQSQQP